MNKRCDYPVGHPDIITENFTEMSAEQDEDDRYFGIIKGTFLPPRGLLHPVLPFKNEENGKLCFALCRTCCSKNLVSRCIHNEEERALFGTYSSPEVYKALACGYKILKLNEVWHYKKKSSELFTT